MTYVIVGVLALVSLLIVWGVPRREVGRVKNGMSDERIRFEWEIRKAVAQIVGGAFVLIGVAATLQSVKQTHVSIELARQGQVTERFTRAIEQLGSAQRDVRVGGLYALERIAKDSQADAPTVLEVVAAFVRG